MRLPRRADKVVRFFVLEDPPHQIHEFRRVAPVPLCVQIPEGNRLGQPRVDSRHPLTDLSREELQPPPGALVVEEDAVRDRQAVRLPVVHAGPVGVDLRHSVGTARVERSHLVLRLPVDPPEHLAGGRLVEASFGGVGPERFQQPHDTEARDLSGQDRLHEGRGDERLGRETVDLIRVRLPDRGVQ